MFMKSIPGVPCFQVLVNSAHSYTGHIYLWNDTLFEYHVLWILLGIYLGTELPEVYGFSVPLWKSTEAIQYPSLGDEASRSFNPTQHNTKQKQKTHKKNLLQLVLGNWV